MRRWLGLSLIVFAVGCAGAPSGSPRGSAPEEEEGPAPAPVVKGDNQEVVEKPAAVVTHDPTKRTETLPPPRTESLSTETLSSPPLTEAASAAEVRAEMERLIKADPVAFLTLVVDRYDSEVKS